MQNSFFVIHAKCFYSSPPVLGFSTDKQISIPVVQSFNVIPSGVVVCMCSSSVVMQYHENTVLIQKAATAQYGSSLAILHVS